MSQIMSENQKKQMDMLNQCILDAKQSLTYPVEADLIPETWDEHEWFYFLTEAFGYISRTIYPMKKQRMDEYNRTPVIAEIWKDPAKVFNGEKKTIPMLGPCELFYDGMSFDLEKGTGQNLKTGETFDLKEEKKS